MYYVNIQGSRMSDQLLNNCLTVGWREWIALPDLGINRIKAKVDTGARTSALHAFSLESFKINNTPRVRFKIHPIQKDKNTVITCEADIYDHRFVRDSGGHKELRYVIKTDIILGNKRWPIEITLTNRDSMGFRMLLGRTAMRDLIVNPNRSFIIHNEGIFK
ncbi:ribosomal protein S6 modification protein [Coxiella burnetii]|uniref:ATP-dependent zinc protease family protein n=1 Tax=Coxiella burnetii TaxID=777 RepID=UPI0007736644|nr:ATP-dependent zinc protease [Coxiella burnetii]AML54496.1 ribosomal protein S6 modification protein [Coxiella burnetii]ATN68458.1 ribosomal protein S6 modification protein [Coxiella burnetii]ATN70387.1 ribosomal protein S6 modification protein [Coxiella burnetii]ATN72324.1 ribosomal protein S6 modification protein [Coxiella burnetii]PNT85672.1 ATP-dependent zinc protease [Coxiella burnetii]